MGLWPRPCIGLEGGLPKSNKSKVPRPVAKKSCEGENIEKGVWKWKRGKIGGLEFPWTPYSGFDIVAIVRVANGEGVVFFAK